MKVIDLLNKIANGEEVPKRIKYNNEIFALRDEKDDYANDNNWFTDKFSFLELNDEVEVIENIAKEDKKIEHLKLYAPYPECTDDRFEDVENKINKIIDRLNREDND